MLRISAVEKTLLAEGLLHSLTYWIPFAGLLTPGALDDSAAQITAVARVLMLVVPHVREPERTELTSIAFQYLEKVV